MGNKLLKEAAVNHSLTSKRGVLERLFTLMFGDFAPPETLRLFGERVMPALAAT